VTDPDAGDEITWSISGGVDAGLFKIDSSTGALTFDPAPDYESTTHGTTYVVEVKATDKAGLFDTQLVTVNVTNVNEAPVLPGDVTLSAAENQTGTGYAHTVTDPDAGDEITWSISGGVDAGLFKIDSSTGALTFDPAPDYESTTHGTTYVVEVKATDKGGLFDTQLVTVNVTNVNKPVSDLGQDAGAAVKRPQLELPTGSLTGSGTTDVGWTTDPNLFPNFTKSFVSLSGAGRFEFEGGYEGGSGSGKSGETTSEVVSENWGLTGQGLLSLGHGWQLDNRGFELAPGIIQGVTGLYGYTEEVSRSKVLVFNIDEMHFTDLCTDLHTSGAKRAEQYCGLPGYHPAVKMGKALVFNLEEMEWADLFRS
jgi:VCBS repeat-containing protein